LSNATFKPRRTQSSHVGDGARRIGANLADFVEHREPVVVDSGDALDTVVRGPPRDLVAVPVTAADRPGNPPSTAGLAQWVS
jgi:hypothetical protein